LKTFFVPTISEKSKLLALQKKNGQEDELRKKLVDQKGRADYFRTDLSRGKSNQRQI